MARKWECQNYLNCHFAISWSWIGYHTSSERGDSGLSADFKNFEIFSKNSYFQACFWVVPALTNLALHFGLSLSHLLLDIRVSYPHLKGIFRAFRWAQLLEYIWCNYRARACVNFSVGSPSYTVVQLESMKSGVKTNLLTSGFSPRPRRCSLCCRAASAVVTIRCLRRHCLCRRHVSVCQSSCHL